MIRTRLAGIYREPFLGAGSMFFAVEPSRAALSDINRELIDAWREAMENSEELLDQIRRLPVDAMTYYGLRARQPESSLDGAVRFIYLNRCCYGGLYRTNRTGQFNVPYGGGSRTPAPLWEKGQLARANSVLRACDVAIEWQDFATAIAHAVTGDVCFLDPTYTALNRGSFDRYNDKLFTWNDQIRLHFAAEAAARRGAVVLVSNVDCPEIRALYVGELVISLRRPKAIGNAIKNSRAQHELLVVYDSMEHRDSWVRCATLTREPRADSNMNDHESDPVLLNGRVCAQHMALAMIQGMPTRRRG
jgi:DNA adenine methylase